MEQQATNKPVTFWGVELQPVRGRDAFLVVLAALLMVGVYGLVSLFSGKPFLFGEAGIAMAGGMMGALVPAVGFKPDKYPLQFFVVTGVLAGIYTVLITLGG